jgi:hypothetical protein
LVKFTIQQQREALFEGERLQLRLFELLRESGGHTAEPQAPQLVQSLIIEHG